MKRYLFAFFALCCINMSAQTDMTSKIENPGFEKDLEGWTCDGMFVQGNSVFKLKKGNNYLEKWTGRGGAVGSASVEQTISGLPAGTYTLTVAAQNIQENYPSTVQTGTYVVANDNKTTINVINDYSVKATIADGELTIGALLKNASGNYVCVDNFRLTLEVPTDETYTEIHAAMQKLVDEAKAVNKNTGTKEQTELDDARKAVEALISKNTTEGVTEAVVRLKDAIYDYRLSIASSDESVDMTNLIVNPSFENKGSAGWVNEGMGAQGNSEFKKKAGSTYMEAWTWHGGMIHDCTLSQVVPLPNGKYVLTAVAQNIQQGSNNKACDGAYLFADEYKTPVGAADTYSLEFVSIENQVNLGFMTRSSSGNWIAVDNFKVTYLGRSEEILMGALKNRTTAAEALAAKHMNNTVAENLNKAITDAKTLTDVSGMADVAIALRESMEAAEKSIDAYAKLEDMIAKAKGYDASGTGADEFLASVSKSEKIYEEASLMETDIEKAVDELDNAILKYRVANASGAVPTVTTIDFVARGATGALGRSTVSGSNIKEKGFCWATHENPTVLDNTTTFTYDINGPMYLMQPLEPATVYYVRAYAMTNDYAVGYGEVRKVITLPMGNTTYWYNNGGSAEENERINNALQECVYYYNNWSSTTNFGISCSYGSGTPTADCSYGGSMRVGPNASYQRTGTILHESNHGVGVGQQARWWDTNLHDGEWKGYRANSLLQFIENNPTSKMAGDSMHMWPYGINGASEDSGWAMLYIANVMITQALHEDGLIPPGHGGCKPAYVFEHDDDVKYYITNENKSYGGGKYFLTENSTGTLTWDEPTDVTTNDAYAWYLTYDPARQLYTIRNAKSGKNFTYTSSSIKTAKKSTLSDSEYFHLMVGRQEKVLGAEKTGVTTRGYWILAGNDVENPLALNATTSGKISSPAFDISDGAATQRWMILTAGEVLKIDSSAADLNREKLLMYASAAKEMLEVGHEDIIQGVSTALETKADGYAQSAADMIDAVELANAVEDMWNTMCTFLTSTKLEDESKPYDLNFLVENPEMTSADVWGVSPVVNWNCSEFFQKTYTMQQNLGKLPHGNYRACVQAFQRPGSYTSVYNKYKNGTLKTTAKTYIVQNTPLKSIMDDAQTKKVGKGVEQKVGDFYIPDNMESADAYFSKGLYDNVIDYEWTKNTDMIFKIFNSSTVDADWSIMRNFRLYYLGNPLADSIKLVTVDEIPANAEYYDITGRKMDKPVKGVVIVKRGMEIVKMMVK